MAAPPPPAPLLGPPPGYRPGTNLPPAVVQHALVVLGNQSLQYGDVDTMDYGGVTYIFRVEPHYDDHAGGGLRWHRGVTVYQPGSGGASPTGGGGGGSSTPGGSGGQRGATPDNTVVWISDTEDIVQGQVYGGSELGFGEKLLLALAGAAVGYFAVRQVLRG